VTDVAHVARIDDEVRGVETSRERISRRQVDKFAERRAQLADAALQTLAENVLRVLDTLAAAEP